MHIFRCQIYWLNDKFFRVLIFKCLSITSYSVAKIKSLVLSVVHIKENGLEIFAIISGYSHSFLLLISIFIFSGGWRSLESIWSSKYWRFRLFLRWQIETKRGTDETYFIAKIVKYKNEFTQSFSKGSSLIPWLVFKRQYWKNP